MPYIPTYSFTVSPANASVSPNPLIEAGSNIIVTGFSNPQTLVTIVAVGLLIVFFLAWAYKFSTDPSGGR